jgi:diketogulonate reductase-like aldo/keto reductase
MMRRAVLHAPHDLRLEELEDPGILEPKDVIIRISATCVCGSDLWPCPGIDTAQAYGDENGVGKGLRASGVARQDMFVTTKLGAEVKSYEKAVSAIDASLETLGLETIDLMIIHSPQPWAEFHGENRYFEGNREAGRALENGYRAGKLRAIGLSNFQRQDVDNILESCSIKPMVNQILAHISNTPADLIRYTQDQGILVEAYSLGRGGVPQPTPGLRSRGTRPLLSAPTPRARWL